MLETGRGGRVVIEAVACGMKTMSASAEKHAGLWLLAGDAGHVSWLAKRE